jgi:hypothetical protein
MEAACLLNDGYEGHLIPNISPSNGLNLGFRLILDNMQSTVAIALRRFLSFEENPQKRR